MMLLQVCGALFAAKVGFDLLLLVWRLLRLYGLPKLGFRRNLKKYGNYAVVTGSTDGIGKAVASELAGRGLNVILISRSADKLDAVAKEIKSKHAVEVKTIQFDFGNDKGYEKIEKELEGLDVGVLVNNVGLSYDHPCYYLELEEKDVSNIMNVNITSVLKMTRIVLKSMTERNGGAIVHLSSSANAFPVPFLNVYSAAKVFVQYFGMALQYEYKSKKIISQVVSPYYVSTKMSKIKTSSLFVPSPETYAKSVINAVGLGRHIYGYWTHEIQSFVFGYIPVWVMTNQVIKLMLGLRSRWLKKQAREKGE